MKPVFVIGDVHGCIHTLKNLIKQLPKKSDIIFVGDLVDKGLYSKDVVEFIIENGYKSTMGNHEQLMIENILKKEKTSWGTLKSFGGEKTLLSYRNDLELLAKHLKWMNKLPYYIEIENFFITHGFGLPYYQRRKNLKYKDAIITNRPSKKTHKEDWEVGFHSYSVTNIFGHAVTKKIDTTKNFIGIDTGAVYGKKLSAIEIPSLRVYEEKTSLEDIVH